MKEKLMKKLLKLNYVHQVPFCKMGENNNAKLVL